MTTIITQENVGQFFKAGPTDRPPQLRATLSDAIVRGVVFREPVRLDGPQKVALESVSFLGDVAAPKGLGLDVVGGRGLTLSKMKWSGLLQAAKLFDCDGLTLSDFECSDIVTDGIIGGSLKNFVFERGRFWKWRTELGGGRHADSIQLARPSLAARTTVSTDGVIRGMQIAVWNTQGIFIPEQERILVEGNTVATDLRTAFGAAKARDITYRDNRAITLPPSPTLAGWDIREALGIKFEGDNVETSYLGRKGTTYSARAVTTDPALAAEITGLRTTLGTSEAALTACREVGATLLEKVTATSAELSAAQTDLAAANAKIAKAREDLA